jgi:hypothetical protein
MRYHYLENNGRAVKFIKDEGLQLVGIGPEGTFTLLPPTLYTLFLQSFDSSLISLLLALLE